MIRIIVPPFPQSGTSFASTRVSHTTNVARRSRIAQAQIACAIRDCVFDGAAFPPRGRFFRDARIDRYYKEILIVGHSGKNTLDIRLMGC
jgi:hypothetical protein